MEGKKFCETSMLRNEGTTYIENYESEQASLYTWPLHWAHRFKRQSIVSGCCIEARIVDIYHKGRHIHAQKIPSGAVKPLRKLIGCTNSPIPCLVGLLWWWVFVCRTVSTWLNVPNVYNVYQCSWILLLWHVFHLGGHPRENSVYSTVRQHFYWMHMAKKVWNSVRQCKTCDWDGLQTKHKWTFQELPSLGPLKCIVIDVLCS